VVSLPATLLRIDNTGFAGLGLGGLKGASQEYPAVAKYVKDHLVSDKAEAFLHAGTLCLEPLENKYSDVGIFSFLNGHDILYEESLKPNFDKKIMGQEAPTIPQFLYHSLGDEISPIENVDELVKKYCDNGGRIQCHKDLESEHAALTLTGSPDAFSWIVDRFEGKPEADGCSTIELATSLEPSGALEILGDVIVGNVERAIASFRRKVASWLSNIEASVESYVESKFESALISSSAYEQRYIASKINFKFGLLHAP
jgi:hypothetical protein